MGSMYNFEAFLRGDMPFNLALIAAVLFICNILEIESAIKHNRTLITAIRYHFECHDHHRNMNQVQ